MSKSYAMFKDIVEASTCLTLNPNLFRCFGVQSLMLLMNAPDAGMQLLIQHVINGPR